MKLIQSSLENLPLDIKLNIFSRLPTESALECKLVCRSWRTLVGHPSFLKMHLNRLKDYGIADRGKAIIKLSYENLENQKLKSCILSCSLCPGDSTMEIGDLIAFWVGEGLLNNVDDPAKVVNEGHDVIKCLKDAGLLDTGTVCGVKMDYVVELHDLVRDLATWIASDYGRIKGRCLTLQEESPLKLDEWEEADRISLTNNTEIDGLHGEPRCAKLSTLFLGGSSISSISDEFFRYMPLLKVLALNTLKLKKLPASLFSIPNLQYLALPEYDDPIGAGSLSLLTKLRMLDVSKSCSNWEVDNGPCLEELESLQHLTFLHIAIETGRALKRLVTSRKLQLCTTYLMIKHCPSVASLSFLPSSPVSDSSLSLGNMSRLSTLQLTECDELEELRILNRDEVTSLKSLESLFLDSLPKLRIMSSRESSCSLNLQRVTIVDCPQLENISSLIHAPNLEALILCNLDRLTEIVSGSAPGKIIFPRLTLLGLGSLSNLGRICNQGVKFHHLEKITVRGCPELKKLPFDSNSVIPQTLMIEGEMPWWETLEWEDEATKANLAQCFRALL